MNRPTGLSLVLFSSLCAPAFVFASLCATAGCATGGTEANPDAAQSAVDAPISVDAPASVDAQASADASPPAIDASPPQADAAPPQADAACVPEWIELLQNGNFDSGNSDWAATTNGSPILRESNSPWPPNDGTFWALFLGYNNGAQTLSQTVSVPASATSLRLQGFRCWVTLESTPTPYDFLNIELRDTGGTLLEALWNRDNSHADATCSWSMFQLNATDAYAGQDIALVIDATSDAASVSSFGFDSLSLSAYACP